MLLLELGDDAMIIQEGKGSWKIIKQHDHAYVSWQVAVNWKEEYLPYPSARDQVFLAVRQHDRAWIPLDEEALWDINQEKPYDFIKYPVNKKLPAYQRGIDELEKMSWYAALLSSGHYTSFFSNDHYDSPAIADFLKQEKIRKEKIHNYPVTGIAEEQVREHLNFLQFCDDLSLYICLNPPGISKEKEFPWFKNGFRQSFPFAPKGMRARWLSKTAIKLTPFPFRRETEIKLPVFEIKKTPKREAFLEEWRQASPAQRKVKLV